MEKLHTPRKVSRRTRVGLGAAIIVALMLITTVVVSLVNSGPVKPAMCEAQAAKQLSPAVVKTVEGNQRVQRIPAMDKKNAIGEVIATHEIDTNWRADAFIGFLPKFCGYVGNINNFPTSKAAERGEANHALNAVDHDNVIVIKRGVQMTVDDNNVCIGDSPPTARHLSNGGIEMTLYCDRSYASATWVQKNPRLVPVK